MTTLNKAITLPKHLRPASAVAACTFVGLWLAVSPCWAALSPTTSSSSAASITQPEVVGLLRKARDAMKQGHPGVAVIYLKNAQSIAPQNPTVRLELGVALLNSGNSGDAERELRVARQRGAAPAQVLPPLFQAMLANHEARQLLLQFPSPGQSDHSALAQVTLRARAAAQMQLGQNQAAVASLDQALAGGHTIENLTARAQLAHEMGDNSLAAKLTDEALSKAPSNIPALLMKVTLLQTANQATQALRFADGLVKQAPKSPLSLMTRAGVYLQLNQDAKALADIDAALASKPDLPQAVYYKAIVKARSKDPKGAWTLAQTLPPGFVHSRADVGIAVSQMAFDAGQHQIGMSTLSYVVTTFPKNVDARIRLALEYLQQKDVKHALQTLSPLEDTTDPRAMVLLGQAYADEKNYAKSLKYLESASATGFGGDVLKQQVATSNLRVGNLDDAIKEFQQLSAKQPANPQIAGPLIAALSHKGDVEAAAKVAEKLGVAAPKSPYGPLFEGQILAQKGDVDGAISAFSEALKREPKFVPAAYDRAMALVARGDLKAAYDDLQTVLASAPKNAMVLIKQAQIVAQLGQAEKAQALYERAAKDNPKDVLPSIALADYYLEHNLPKDAMAATERFLHASPKNASGIAMRGKIQLNMGAVGQAISTFQGLATAHPHSAQVQMLLATALARKGDVAAASRALRQAVQLAPTMAIAHTSLIAYEFRTKQEAAALKAAQDYAAKEPGPESAQALARALMTLKKTN